MLALMSVLLLVVFALLSVTVLHDLTKLTFIILSSPPFFCNCFINFFLRCYILKYKFSFAGVITLPLDIGLRYHKRKAYCVHIILVRAQFHVKVVMKIGPCY